MRNIVKSFKELKVYEWLMIVIMIFIAGRAMVMSFTSGGGGNPPWLTVLNFISAICGIVCIFFCAKANISNFIFGLVNTIVYAIFLWYWKIYGTFCLEVLYYLPMNIISWIRWAKNRDVIETHKTLSKRLTIPQNILCVGIVLVVAVITHFVLVQVSGNVAWLDAFTTAIGLVACALELKRYAEQYVWWIITDIIAVAMYIVQFDPVYLTKKSIYLIMAVVGLYNWIKLNKTRNVNNE